MLFLITRIKFDGNINNKLTLKCRYLFKEWQKRRQPKLIEVIMNNVICTFN